VTSDQEDDFSVSYMLIETLVLSIGRVLVLWLLQLGQYG
jgi:hypothetical protein